MKQKKEGIECSCKAVFILLCHCMKGTHRKMVSVPGKGGCCCPGPARRLFNEGVYVEGVQVMGGLEIEDVFLFFWANRPSKGVLVGTAPLDCIEILSVAVIPGGRIWFHSIVLFYSPLPCFMFLKAVVARSPSWTLQPLKESVPSSESLCQEPEALRSHRLWEHRCPQLGLTRLYTLLAFCLFSWWVKPRSMGARRVLEKNFSRIVVGFWVCFFFLLSGTVDG